MVQMNFKDIKIIISEVDGVITEGLSGIGEMNITMFKQFHMSDFEAINLIKKDRTFVFLSADASINSSLCKTKNIPFFHAAKSKRDVYGNVLRRYSFTPDNVLYIGSTYSDLESMRISAFSICPEDAPSAIKNSADLVIPLMSGTGVISYVYDFLETNKNTECDIICQP